MRPRPPIGLSECKASPPRSTLPFLAWLARRWCSTYGSASQPLSPLILQETALLFPMLGLSLRHGIQADRAVRGVWHATAVSHHNLRQYMQLQPSLLDGRCNSLGDIPSFWEKSYKTSAPIIFKSGHVQPSKGIHMIRLTELLLPSAPSTYSAWNRRSPSFSLPWWTMTLTLSQLGRSSIPTHLNPNLTSTLGYFFRSARTKSAILSWQITNRPPNSRGVMASKWQVRQPSSIPVSPSCAFIAQVRMRLHKLKGTERAESGDNHRHIHQSLSRTRVSIPACPNGRAVSSPTAPAPTTITEWFYCWETCQTRWTYRIVRLASVKDYILPGPCEYFLAQKKRSIWFWL